MKLKKEKSLIINWHFLLFTLNLFVISNKIPTFVR